MFNINDVTAGNGNIAVGLGDLNNTINLNYPYHRKSLSCPYCNPKCPHGYPVETGPQTPTYPQWTIVNQNYTIPKYTIT